MTTLIRDNRQLNSWPESSIIAEEETINHLDSEPFAQKIMLSCGHWLINTYGDHFPKYEIGFILRCRSCGMKDKK